MIWLGFDSVQSIGDKLLSLILMNSNLWKEGVQGSHEPMESRGGRRGPVARLGSALCRLVSAGMTRGGVRVGIEET
jgi:hypothetical protein